MKRIWLGIGLLLLLMAIGQGVSWKMDHLHETTCLQLRQAVEATQWEKATALGHAAQTQWEAHRRFTASLADHQEVDQIDALFAQLEVYRTQGDTLSHASTCAHLEEAITALQETHRLTWWNLL